MKSILIQYVLLFMLTGCSISDKIYDFYPIKPQSVYKGKVNISIIGTWVNRSTYSSPYDVSIIYNSPELGRVLKIKSLVIVDSLTNNIVFRDDNINIRTEKPETVLRDNTQFIGVKKLGKIHLNQNKYSINIKTLLPNNSIGELSLLLKPYFRNEIKSIRAIFAN